MKILYFLLIPFILFAQTRLYYENFDDKDIDQPGSPFNGAVNIYLGNWIVPVLGTHYTFDSTGYSGYCLSDIGCDDVDPHLVWFPDTWNSDTLYVSYQCKFDCENLQSYPNLKVYYPHWDGTGSYVHLTMAGDNSIYYSASASGSMLEISTYATCNGMVNGNWHKYEFWIVFPTAEFKFWYDGELKLDKNYTNGVWGSSLYYTTAYKEDASGGGTGTDLFTRQLDEWEIWNGLPTGGDVTAPNATVTLTKVSNTSITYAVSNISSDIDTMLVKLGADTIYNIKNSTAALDTTLTGLSAGWNTFVTRLVDDSSNVTTRSDSVILGVAKVATMISLIKVN